MSRQCEQSFKYPYPAVSRQSEEASRPIFRWMPQTSTSVGFERQARSDCIEQLGGQRPVENAAICKAGAKGPQSRLWTIQVGVGLWPLDKGLLILLRGRGATPAAAKRVPPETPKVRKIREISAVITISLVLHSSRDTIIGDNDNSRRIVYFSRLNSQPMIPPFPEETLRPRARERHSAICTSNIDRLLTLLPSRC